MSTLHDVIAEVRANAHSAQGVAPVARRDGNALYAMSDQALLEALGHGGDPPERGPVESRDGAVPSNASEDAPPPAMRPLPLARGLKGDPTPMRIGTPAMPNPGTAMPNPGKRRGRPLGSKNKKGPKRDPNGIDPGGPPPPHFGSNLTSAPSDLHDPDPWT